MDDGSLLMWQRSRALRAIGRQLDYMEEMAGRDEFSREARIALYGKATMAADLMAITAEEWSGFYDRLRALTEREERGG